jgi:hypothetical protein
MEYQGVLNFADALALLRRMDHSTLHDWVIHTTSHAHSIHMIILSYILSNAHISPRSLSFTPHPHWLWRGQHILFLHFACEWCKKSKKPKKYNNVCNVMQ